MNDDRKLFCFGLGYSAKALARRLDAQGWKIAGTCRSSRKRQALERLGIECGLFDGLSALRPRDVLHNTTHVLISIPPDSDGDSVLRWHARDLAGSQTVESVGYLSTTGVYGDRNGEWVDETSDLRPGSARARRRVVAEQGWLDWGRACGKTVQVFRLAGIYGPGRSVLDRVREGTAKRIVKPGQVFSRIHVEDIATVLEAAMRSPRTSSVYNVCDDEPAPLADVIEYACKLSGVPVPPDVALEDAELSPMARSFWSENRRVDNKRIKRELGVSLSYPDYRTGLRALAGL